MNIKDIILNKLPEIKALRKTLHKNAELAHKEFKTQKIIMETLESLNIKYDSCAGTGVVGVLNNAETSIGVRADIDALPINGVFHGCGHDYHTAIALGTAMILKEMGFEKCVKFLFQPAEELDGGAYPMIQEGALKNPEVKYMIGFHVWPNLEVGKIEAPAGPSMASIDDFSINFKGVGGHAAIPHLCKNPIYPAIDFIQTMNNKTKMEVNPLNPHVLTFSSINANNTASNVIPEKIEVLGTLRAFDPTLVDKIKKDLYETCALSAKKYDCEFELNFSVAYPPLTNDKDLCDKFYKATVHTLGEKNVLTAERTFAAEDFAFFAQEVPSVHFRIGISDDIQGLHPLHSPMFDANDDAIYFAIHTIVNFILEVSDEI